MNYLWLYGLSAEGRCEGGFDEVGVRYAGVVQRLDGPNAVSVFWTETPEADGEVWTLLRVGFSLN